MKVIYYLPAHPSYFTDDTYTQEDVNRAVSLFKLLTKPGKLGEIPEEFVFLTEPGKNTSPVFHSNDMNSPDEKTEERWTANTLKLAEAASNSEVEFLKSILKGLKKNEP